MKKRNVSISSPLSIIGILSIIFFISACGNGSIRDYPVTPVLFTQVDVNDQFWSARLETNRTVTIPYTFGQCEETGRIANFAVAGGMQEGTFEGAYTFNDSDVFKIIEGASYSLHVYPDPELEAYVDDIIAKIAAAQEDDGYLYTARTINPDPPVRWVEAERWTNLRIGHELYNVGHLYEAAAAHFQATGKRTLLDIAEKNADLIDSVFGPDKIRDVPGHQVIEIGLAKLYRVTGKKKYLELAKFFLDERGRANGRKLYGEYSQDHKPVVEQEEAVGHAVRAVYMYAGMADVAALTGDQAYIDAIDRIWNNVVSKKMYLTGGVGATGAGEAFGKNYDLPNASAYAETCAAIANAMWNHRMFLLHGNADYIDVLERVIYNGALSGVSFKGDRFFYPNPLHSYGQHQRSPWFSCACCPSNMTRFMPSIPGYMYARQNGDVYINLYTQGKASLEYNGTEISLLQKTRYPWDGLIEIEVTPAESISFSLKLRIPGWARNKPVPSDLYRYMKDAEDTPRLALNGTPQPLEISNGYVTINKLWEQGDLVTLNLPMPVRRVLTHDQVKENSGKVALERGPLVYCAEWTDNQGRTGNLLLDDMSEFSLSNGSDDWQNMVLIQAEGGSLHRQESDGAVEVREQNLTLIPYFAWAHRGKGEMSVWLPREKAAGRPLPPPTLASLSKTRASGDKRLFSINDLYEPTSSDDHTVPSFDWWPRKGTLEWVELDFPGSSKISSVSVYWFDDTGRGECRVPASWKVQVKKGDNWVQVKNPGEYGTAKDRYNTVTFSAVQTSSIRLEIQLPEKFSTGIHEVRVK